MTKGSEPVVPAGAQHQTRNNQEGIRVIMARRVMEDKSFTPKMGERGLFSCRKLDLFCCIYTKIFSTKENKKYENAKVILQAPAHRW